MKMNSFRALEARATMLLTDESGMSTVEYAIGTLFICPCRVGSFVKTVF
ncbi:DUF4244 domain-containing protein [Mycolicibacterium mucogenicum]|uniref:DUF4244 domain-containing protein n=1 Tax=Mycolicibacterium mucogenicum DSM 44124 TaxID=1226753 RepID=A0A8E4R6U7_MYCMU|nr:hypothetical protein MMUC44124_16530 [Mycolicibacterium mucogenicum DSM 44124]QPG68935.1 DUF4244 domain-containing protein [Mycolicibacterium mucogenicum DSM 44124]